MDEDTDSSLSRWLRSAETKFFLIALVVFGLSAGYLLYQKQMHIRSLYKRLAGSQDVLVQVESETITRGAFEKRLWERHAQKELAQESLLFLLREATKTLDLDSRMLRTLDDAKRENSIELSGPADEVEYLEEKFLLSKVTDTDRRQLYDSDKEKLATYELSVLRFESAESAEQFVSGFLKGMTPERAAEEFSLDPHPVQLNPIMNQDLEKEFGVFHARAIRELAPGRYSGPIPNTDGHYTVYRVGRVDTDFEQVLPAINTVFARKGREDTRRAVVENANIVSEQITPEDLINLKI